MQTTADALQRAVEVKAKPNNQFGGSRKGMKFPRCTCGHSSRTHDATLGDITGYYPCRNCECRDFANAKLAEAAKAADLETGQEVPA